MTTTKITVLPSQNNPFWQRREVLFVLRFLWFTLVFFTILMLGIGLPRAFVGAMDTYDNPLNWRGAAAISMGIPVQVLAWYYFIVDAIMMAVAAVVALLLFWRGGRDGALILISLSLLTGPVLLSDAFNSLLSFEPALLPATHALGFVIALFGMIPYLFSPDGRPVPSWAGWVLIPWVAYNAIRYFVFPDTVGTAQEPPLYLIFYTFGGWAQIYRYRHATAEVKQQYKWILFGLVILVVGLALNIVYAFVHEDTNQFIAELITPTINRLSFALLDVLLVIAILRYRIWDIDFIINRSILYGVLTVVLGGLFVGGYLIMQTVIGAIMGQGQGLVAAAVPGVVVAALFEPTRTRVRRFVDKRFYGIEVDYQHAPRIGDSEPFKGAMDTSRTSFGGYKQLEPIGSGGMGEVYRAQHPTLSRSVAIKILPKHLLTNEEARHRFQREAQTIAKMNHPNIVRMHDIGDADGTPYMVMEYIDGKDLSVILKQRGAIPLEETAQILGDVAAALDYIHQNSVIHRDIKPSNVMVERVTASNGRMQRAILMDFGIAKLSAANTQLTQAGIIGTLDYMAPEQIQGADTVTAQADIYSLGVMAYQMITGALPFDHQNPGALVMAHLMQPPPDPRDHVPNLPEEAAEAIMQAMSKKSERRYKTASAFIRAMC